MIIPSIDLARGHAVQLVGGREQALDAAFELGMFVLLEAFDVAEIERCADLISTYPEHRRNLPLGLNCRDLQTLQIDPARLDAAAG